MDAKQKSHNLCHVMTKIVSINEDLVSVQPVKEGLIGVELGGFYLRDLL